MSSPSSSISVPSAQSSPEVLPVQQRSRAMSSGTIKTFDASQGQGWIRPSDGSKDVHFHLNSMQTNLKTLFPGQKITFAVREEGEPTMAEIGKDRIAVEVEAEDGHLEPRFLRLGY